MYPTVLVTNDLELDMPQDVVPMIHVPDVSATVDWYVSIGFKLVRQNENRWRDQLGKLSFGTA